MGINNKLSIFSQINEILETVNKNFNQSDISSEIVKCRDLIDEIHSLPISELINSNDQKLQIHYGRKIQLDFT